MARLVLALCTVLPAVGLAVNLLWPPRVCGYEMELILLVMVGMCALLVARHDFMIDVAVLAYCAVVLVPVALMLERHASMGGTGAWLMGTPLACLLMVAALTGCSRATAAYVPIAIVGGLVYGGIYGNEGAAGALAVGAVVLGAVAVVFCRKWQAWRGALRSAVDRTEAIQESLDSIEEHYGRK